MLPALVLAAALSPGPLGAQEGFGPCEEGTPHHASCVEAAVALQAARAAIGLAAAGGADLPGTGSTLGKRIGSTPRFALALRAGAARAPIAGLGSDAHATDESAWLTSLRADAGFGLFDGFSAAPTVGGILAVDLLGSVALVSTPDDHGLDGGSVTGAGVGVRVGVFRESFTLPGVTLTATRRWLGESTVGTFGEQGGRGAELETTVTSVRALVGKDFFAIGFLAGGGWDRYEGDASIQAPSGTADPAHVVLEAGDDLDSDRLLFFGNVSWNFLVLQLSAEGGWAGGLDEIPGRTDGFDPGRGSLFGAVALRLIL